MSIADEIISKVKATNDIVDIINQYTKLTKSSNTWYIGSCPFHDETDGSFKVNQATQSWFCFGCGKGTRDGNDNKGSDVIAFIQEVEEVSFQDAVKILAERSNIIVEEVKENINVTNAKKKATDHNRRYYTNLWSKSEDSIKALDYLYNRGLNDETIQKFRLGLVPKNEENRRSDINDIVGKIAIPIIEVKNVSPRDQQTLAMSYRLPYNSDISPKYKNDCNNDCFTKKYNLYGLNFAYENIRKQKEGIIVECYVGTMMLHQHNITNVVSTMGTKISDEQVALMKKYTNNWTLLLDGDKAGREALVRVLPMMLKNNINASVVVLPEFEDPDTFILKIGYDKFIEWFNSNKVSLLDYIVNNVLFSYETQVNKLKEEALQKLSPILTELKDNKKLIIESLIKNRINIK